MYFKPFKKSKHNSNKSGVKFKYLDSRSLCYVLGSNFIETIVLVRVFDGVDEF